MQAHHTKTESEAPKVRQKDAVRQFAQEVLANVAKADGQALKDLVTKEVRKVIRTKLFEGIKAGRITLKRPMDDSKLKKYCSSLINNWLKKDEHFN